MPNHPAPNPDPYRLSVEEYTTFRRNGFLVVRNLITPSEVEELRQHTENLMQGRLPEQQKVMDARDPNADTGVSMQALEAPPAHLTPSEKAEFFLRIHMLHRRLELHEYYLLHPRVLDVMEAIIGPDVLAMQTMLFLKPPGKPGQGWHQDSYYIPTHPDTLCGAWIAIDACDEQNGAMWFALGSAAEPIYPPSTGYGYGDRLLKDIAHVDGISNDDDTKNDLTPIANKYPQVLCPAQPGDVVFFNGHIMHRSKRNFTKDRFRRSFVSHYCNARSYTQWGKGSENITYHQEADAIGCTNQAYILARGDTHLPFGKPRFGTPCAALQTKEERARYSEFVFSVQADASSGQMDMAPATAKVDEDD